MPKALFAVCCGVMPVTLIVLRVLRRPRRHRWAFCAYVALVAAALATCVSSWALAGLDAATAELGDVPISKLRFRCEGDPTPTKDGWFLRATTRLPSGRMASAWMSCPEGPAPGAHLVVAGRFKPNEDDEWGRSSRSRGVCGKVSVTRVVTAEQPRGAYGAMLGLRSRLTSWIVGKGGDEARALLAGSITADRTSLELTGTDDLFASVGLAHLIAVSGSHLVVVGASLEAALLALGITPRRRGVLLVGVTGIYVLFCGALPNAVRSWVMLVSSRGARLWGRRGYDLSGLALTGLVMCLSDPFCACDLGFELSVLSVGGLCLFALHAEALLSTIWQGLRKPHCRGGRHLLPRRLRRPLGKLARSLRSMFAASLVCQVATVPACAVAFSKVSLVAPLANLVVGPLFVPLVPLGMVACVLSGVPVLGKLALGCAVKLCRVAVLLARGLSALPFACLPVVAAPWTELVPLVVAACLLVFWPRPTARQLGLAGAACLVLMVTPLVRWTFLAPARVVILDVGQGDAILVQDGVHAILVDTGPGDAVLPALARTHVLGLDAVVLSHLHADHTGGLDDVEGSIGCRRLLVGSGAATKARGLSETSRQELARGDSLQVGRFRLSCVAPESGGDGSENEDSLVLLLEFDDGRGATLRALLTGDAEAEQIRPIIGQAGDLDLLKLGHHGSRVSIDESEARSLAPELSVASAGEGNRYGHPTHECVRTVTDAGSRFLCTMDVGDVEVCPSPDGMRVRCDR